ADFQGGTTNRISVIVTDDGPGNLSATQSFSVIVRNTRSDFILSLGSTNLLAGESNSIPLILASGTDLAAIGFVLEVAESNITSLALIALAPQIATVTRDRYAPDHLRFTITAQAGNPFQGTFPLARLSVNTVTNEHSIIVPVPISSVTGTRRTGAA